MIKIYEKDGLKVTFNPPTIEKGVGALAGIGIFLNRLSGLMTAVDVL